MNHQCADSCRKLIIINAMIPTQDPVISNVYAESGLNKRNFLAVFWEIKPKIMINNIKQRIKKDVIMFIEIV